MRDKNRIYAFCNELANEWSTHYELRFGQFIINIFDYITNKYGIDPFFIEEDKIMEYIKEYCKKEW